MDLGESFHIWRRRWILTVAMVILALAGALAALTGLPRAYQSSSSVILLASQSAAKANGGNPYLSFSPSLTLTADAVSRELMAPATAQGLAAEGYIGAYTVALAPDTTATTGSVLLVTVTDGNKAVVEPTLQAVDREISVKLAQLQAHVAPRNRIRDTALAANPQATLSASRTIRPLVAITVLGLLAALAIPIAVDGLIARRLIHSSAVVPAASPDPADVPPYGDRDAGDQSLDYWPPAARNGGQSHRAPKASR